MTDRKVWICLMLLALASLTQACGSAVQTHRTKALEKKVEALEARWALQETTSGEPS